MFDFSRAILAVVVTLFPHLLAAQDCTENDFPASLVWPADQTLPVPAIPVEKWFISGADWIVAPNGCMAAIVADEIRAARAAFEQYFESAETSGAVIDLRYVGQSAALSAAGVDWVLPWKFAVSRSAAEPAADPVQAMVETQIRSQVEQQLSQNGQPPDPERVDALVEQALSQWQAANVGASEQQDQLEQQVKQADAIRHEVAHLLFIHGLWPSTKGLDQYGGDAPDWLDEAAAVVVESEAMTASRRDNFFDDAAQDQLMPLQDYLAMPHPAFAGGALQELVERARAESDGTAMIFISGDDLPSDHLSEAGKYYSQTRGWIDFLIETSQRPRIFADLTQALKAGDSFEDWLSVHGKTNHLPDQIDALQAAFIAWSKTAAAQRNEEA